MHDIALAADEAAQLAEHEAVIERGIKTFYEVGLALADIRDRKLYRAEYGTFEEYAERRWQMSRRRAYQMIEAAGVVHNFSHSEIDAPATESQARELSRVPELERVAVWAETVERTRGKPTAAAVRETYEQQRTTDDVHLLAGDDWVQPDDPSLRESATPPLVAPKPKRRPLPEALTEASRDYVRAAERLARITEDDRFPKNRDTTHHQLPEVLGALDLTARFIAALRLDQAQASGEARRWWATSLRNTSDALTDVVNTLDKEL